MPPAIASWKSGTWPESSLETTRRRTHSFPPQAISGRWSWRRSRGQTLLQPAVWVQLPPAPPPRSCGTTRWPSGTSAALPRAPWLGDRLAAGPPELLDAADAPQGALPGRPDRLAADQHVDRVGVHLREVPQRHPAAPLDRHVETQRRATLSSAGTSLRRGHRAVDDQLDQAQAALAPGLVRVPRPVQGHRVAGPGAASRGSSPPCAMPSGVSAANATFAFTFTLPGRVQLHVARPAPCRRR